MNSQKSIPAIHSSIRLRKITILLFLNDNFAKS